MTTFIEAFAKGEADKYRGHLIRGGGVPLQLKFEGGDLVFGTLVIARRPDGSQYEIKMDPDTDQLNFDSEDRVFSVCLVFKEGKGVPSNLAAAFFNQTSLLRRWFSCFHARFHGEYKTAALRRSGQPTRKEEVPVLEWEAWGDPRR